MLAILFPFWCFFFFEVLNICLKKFEQNKRVARRILKIHSFIVVFYLGTKAKPYLNWRALIRVESCPKAYFLAANPPYKSVSLFDLIGFFWWLYLYYKHFLHNDKVIPFLRSVLDLKMDILKKQPNPLFSYFSLFGASNLRAGTQNSVVWRGEKARQN